MRSKRRASSSRSSPSAWRGGRRLVGHDEQQVAGLGAQQPLEGRALVVGQELGDRRAPRAVVLHERPHEPAGAEALDELGQRVELLARHLARPGVEPAHDASGQRRRTPGTRCPRPPRRGRGSRARSACRAGRSRSAPSPRRRPSAATAAAAPRSPSPRTRGRASPRSSSMTSSSSTKDISRSSWVNSGWRSAREVLVAEAAGDLVVALEAGHHQQLLEELRRLRQRVERARADAGRDEEVARALGRGAGEDRRLDLEEVVRVEVVAHRARDRVAQRSARASTSRRRSIIAVAQAQRLVDRRVLVDRERRRLGRRPGARPRRPTARSRPWRSFGFSLPSSRRTISPCALRACSGRSCWASAWASRRVLGVEDELEDARAVAQVDEDQAAVVAAAVDPARHADALAGARGVELARPGVAVRVGAGRPHSPWRDVVHDGVGLHLSLLAGLHVLQRRTLVAEDGNVAGASRGPPA